MKKKHILITATVIIGIFLIYILSEKMQESRVRGNVAAAFEEFEPVNDEVVERIDENLLSSGLATKLLVSSKSDSCRELSRFIGFSSDGWQLTCTLKYLRFYETQKSIDELDIAFENTPELKQELNVSSYRDSTSNCPGLYREPQQSSDKDWTTHNAELSDLYGGFRNITIQYIPLGSLRSFKCEFLDQIKYTTADYDKKTHSSYRQIESFKQSNLQPETDGFWFEYEVDYFSEHWRH